LSYLYFFRHGQAGTRDSYDQLSAIGQRQAELLGEYLVTEGLRFSAAYVGSMSRQQQTASGVAAAYARAGQPFPNLETVPAWNEFDLDRVYREMAPPIAAADPQFRREYEVQLEQVRASQGSEEADVHRRWSPCDIRVVDAWIRSLYPYSGESWDAFCSRVGSPRASLNGAEVNVAIFTSATPIAIWTGLALDIHDHRMLQLAGALYNTSITVLRLRAQQLHLFSFNGVPHLAGAALRTHR
jgi:broad specificity phosphatase PhoE